MLYQIAKKYETVNSTIKLATKILCKNLYVKEQGIPFCDMMLFNAIFYAKISKMPYLNDCSYGDILISRSGTVGNTIIVGNSYNGTAVSEHAMRLVIDKRIK